MDLYIANTTKQRHNISFRVLETGKERHYPIEPGGQRLVMRNGSQEEVNAIIARYEPYGMVECRTLDQQPDFIGLLYRIDKPVEAAQIEKALRDNGGKLNRQSHEQRQAVAAALETQLSGEQTGFRGEIEMSAEQQVNKLDPNDEQKIKEVIKADPNAPAPAKRGRKKK